MLLNLGILIVANVLAYQARDVPIEYQENRYIAISMASILQALVLGMPLLFVVKDSPQGKFFVQLAIIFVTCSATMLLIFVSKASSVGIVPLMAPCSARRVSKLSLASCVGIVPRAPS